MYAVRVCEADESITRPGVARTLEGRALHGTRESPMGRGVLGSERRLCDAVVMMMGFPGVRAMRCWWS